MRKKGQLLEEYTGDKHHHHHHVCFWDTSTFADRKEGRCDKVSPSCVLFLSSVVQEFVFAPAHSIFRFVGKTVIRGRGGARHRSGTDLKKSEYTTVQRGTYVHRK